MRRGSSAGRHHHHLRVDHDRRLCPRHIREQHRVQCLLPTSVPPPLLTLASAAEVEDVVESEGVSPAVRGHCLVLRETASGNGDEAAAPLSSAS